MEHHEKVFEFFEEEIFISSPQGYVLRINPEAEKVMGVKAEDLVGRHVSELVKNKIISSSSTLEVIKQRRKVNILQNVRDGTSRLSTGVPVFNEQGEMQFILCTSKDITELVNLRKELEEKENEIKQKNEELSLLQEEVFAQVNFISKSPEMKQIKQTINKIVDMDLTVLIQGETGVGKEVVAKTIYNLSKKKGSFVKINCGLIPKDLLDSELFGYETGAFTGAKKGGKLGKIELAHKGTLFLDEIGEMPYDLQVKLLDFLQDSQITRVGGTKKIKIDARIIAATNRNLQEMVNKGTFRKDLYYRLNIIPINVPPLRERIDDIPILAEYFLKKVNARYQIKKKLDTDIIANFMRYSWPGNVRELEHVIERLTIMSDAAIISSEYFQTIIGVEAPASAKIICTEIIPYKHAKRELEQQLVTKAYKVYKSTYKAAEVLGIDQSTVVNQPGIQGSHKDVICICTKY